MSDAVYNDIFLLALAILAAFDTRVVEEPASVEDVGLLVVGVCVEDDVVGDDEVCVVGAVVLCVVGGADVSCGMSTQLPLVLTCVNILWASLRASLLK